MSILLYFFVLLDGLLMAARASAYFFMALTALFYSDFISKKKEFTKRTEFLTTALIIIGTIFMIHDVVDSIDSLASASRVVFFVAMIPCALFVYMHGIDMNHYLRDLWENEEVRRK